MSKCIRIKYFCNSKQHNVLNKMTTVKKIILFLFGILLIVFGNKAAIDTIFKNNDGLKAPDLEEKEVEGKNSVITEEIESKETETISNNAPVSSSNVSDVKKVEAQKTEVTKVSTEKPAEKTAKEQPAKVSEKKGEQKVEKVSATKIEPVQEESAAASE